MSDSDFTSWRDPDTAPKDGEQFLAELSNGDVTILHAPMAVRRGWSFAWWRGHYDTRVPYHQSHPASTDWTGFPLITGWMPLPKSRNQPQRETEDTSGG